MDASSTSAKYHSNRVKLNIFVSATLESISITKTQTVEFISLTFMSWICSVIIIIWQINNLQVQKNYSFCKCGMPVCLDGRHLKESLYMSPISV
jgi:hypothetical protein